VSGYINLPCHLFLQFDLTHSQWQDDINVGSCKQVSEDASKRENDDAYYQDVIDIKDPISGPFAQEFGKTKEEIIGMTMNKIGSLADTIFAERFEGVKGGGY
jgi:hypothetical protein